MFFTLGFLITLRVGRRGANRSRACSRDAWSHQWRPFQILPKTQGPAPLLILYDPNMMSIYPQSALQIACEVMQVLTASCYSSQINNKLCDTTRMSIRHCVEPVPSLWLGSFLVSLDEHCSKRWCKCNCQTNCTEGLLFLILIPAIVILW